MKKAVLADTGKVVNVYFDEDENSWYSPNTRQFYQYDELDFLEDYDKGVDWESRRFLIAKDLLIKLFDKYNNIGDRVYYAVEHADALIAELKKGGANE